MSNAKKGLGRGLSALMGDMEPVQTNKGVDVVDITELEPNPDQPRKTFDDEELNNLASSIREKGVLQPILVRLNPRETTRYEIIAGERRWRASQRAPIHQVPVLVQQMSDAEVLEVALVENVQRVDLNPMEEAESYARLMEAYGYTQEQLSKTVSKSRSHVANMVRLTKLPDRVAGHLRDGNISAGHARALLSYPEAEILVEEIVRKGLSVRETESRVSPPPAGYSAPAPKTPQKDTSTLALEEDLSAALGVPVAIQDRGNGKGTVVLTYRSLEELDEICERFGYAS